MNERIGIFVAWPYANGDVHLGHVAGAYALAGRVQRARGRVIIVPGAGITAANVEFVAKETGAWEFHAGLSSIFPGEGIQEQSFADEVRKLVEQLTRHQHSLG